MRMVLVAYNVAIDEEVMEALGRAGVENYTKWPRVFGKGRTSGTHLDNDVWPGANSVVMAVVDDEIASKVMNEIRGLRETMGHEGAKAFLLNVEDIT